MPETETRTGQDTDGTAVAPAPSATPGVVLFLAPIVAACALVSLMMWPALGVIGAVACGIAGRKHPLILGGVVAVLFLALARAAVMGWFFLPSIG
ncbi:hypothetical protein [Isoptericola croceus]|uniref:hypothetical protein n=1 Tax=Isoptericola croceus TaxID=3031406 RepID=UPI0023F832C3|nr:hypothetical protein [Isoptericola croceus]